MAENKNKELGSIFNAKSLLDGQGARQRDTAQSRKVAMDFAGMLDKAGTSEGAKRGWETRRGGGGEAVPEGAGGISQGDIDNAKKGIEEYRKKMMPIRQEYMMMHDEITRGGERGVSDKGRAILQRIRDKEDAVAGEFHEKFGGAVKAAKQYVMDRISRETGGDKEQVSERFHNHIDDSTREDAGPLGDARAVLQWAESYKKKEDTKKSLSKDGTSEGAKKGWETRKRGGATEEPKGTKIDHPIFADLDLAEEWAGDTAGNLQSEGWAQVGEKQQHPGGGSSKIYGNKDGTEERIIQVHPGKTRNHQASVSVTQVRFSAEGAKDKSLNKEGDTESPFAVMAPVDKEGSSEGAKKGWDTRRAGGEGGGYVTPGMPIKGHPYHEKTEAQLKYIIQDASEAAQNMRGHDPKAEGKYLDQVNDAHTVLAYRKRQGISGPLKLPTDDPKTYEVIYRPGGKGTFGEVRQVTVPPREDEQTRRLWGTPAKFVGGPSKPKDGPAQTMKGSMLTEGEK